MSVGADLGFRFIVVCVLFSACFVFSRVFSFCVCLVGLLMFVFAAIVSVFVY